MNEFIIQSKFQNINFLINNSFKSENEDNNYVTVKPGTPSPASAPIMSPFVLDFSDQYEDAQKDNLKKLTDLI